jgi:hypothetical protein
LNSFVTNEFPETQMPDDTTAGPVPEREAEDDHDLPECNQRPPIDDENFGRFSGYNGTARQNLLT